jgi:hypothetical protein
MQVATWPSDAPAFRYTLRPTVVPQGILSSFWKFVCWYVNILSDAIDLTNVLWHIGSAPVVHMVNVDWVTFSLIYRRARKPIDLKHSLVLSGMFKI